MQRTQVMIVGAGMVGLSLAALIAPSGSQIVIVNGNQAPDPQQGFGARVSALTLASLQLLERCGALEHLPRACCFSAMDVWQADSNGHWHISADEIDQQQLGIIAENHQVEWALRQALAQYANVQILDECRLTQVQLWPEQAMVSAGEQQWLVAQLFAADGANSWLRSQLQLPLFSNDYGHDALVAVIKTQLPHQQVARQAFTADGPLAYLPLADAHHCAIVYSASPQALAKLDLQQPQRLARQLAAAMDNALGDVEAVSDVQQIPLTLRYARQWFDGPAVLLGDAAHTIHPLAGQGANLGLLDAATLAEVYLQALQQGQSAIAARDLARWQRERKADAQKYIAAMQVFHQLFSPQAAALKPLIALGMNLADKLSPAKALFSDLAMGWQPQRTDYLHKTLLWQPQHPPHWWR